MVVCPVCESRRIVLVVSPERRAFCPSCGARWSTRKGWNVVQSDAVSASPHSRTLEEDPNPAA